MRSRPILATLPAVVCLAAASAGADILVTEFMPNPGGTDLEREWIEIYNSGPDAIDISNYKVGDEEAEPDGGPGGEGMFQFPANTIMAPGQVFVIANTALGFEELYGFIPDFEVNLSSTLNSDAVPDMVPYLSWGTATALIMANGGDHALIVDDNDVIIDGANHGNVSKFFEAGVTLATNESLERVPADVDTDSHDDFVFRAAGQATPGAVTIPEPTSLALAGVAAAGLLGRRRR